MPVSQRIVVAGIDSTVHVEWENQEQQSLPVFVPDEWPRRFPPRSSLTAWV